MQSITPHSSLSNFDARVRLAHDLLFLESQNWNFRHKRIATPRHDLPLNFVRFVFISKLHKIKLHEVIIYGVKAKDRTIRMQIPVHNAQMNKTSRLISWEQLGNRAGIF